MKKYFFSGFIIAVMIVAGLYFIWQKRSKQNAIVSVSDKAINIPQNESGNTASMVNSKAILPLQSNTTNQHTDITSSNFKTYTNPHLGISFKYPDNWTQGAESNGINLKGEILTISVNFNDTISNTTLSITYHLAPYGPEVYKLEEDQYIVAKTSNHTDTKQITVAGNKAIESFSTMTKDIHGNIYDPAIKLIHIVLLDEQKTGAYNLNFRTPAPGSEAEIAKFNRVISSFKFIAE